MADAGACADALTVLPGRTRGSPAANNGRLVAEGCFTRDGSLPVDCTLELVAKLRRKRLTGSRNAGPDRITALGRRSVRAQADNRG
ncbi:YjhX family toxin [Pseudooceanicola nanhaiensis]|uniref:YjhX family toxin n=1 Tax=Pseudooceanicola nanhaiensis TaxID=375761 RepID=UPI003516E037